MSSNMFNMSRQNISVVNIEKTLVTIDAACGSTIDLDFSDNYFTDTCISKLLKYLDTHQLHVNFLNVCNNRIMEEGASLLLQYLVIGKIKSVELGLNYVTFSTVVELLFDPDLCSDQFFIEFQKSNYPQTGSHWETFISSRKEEIAKHVILNGRRLTEGF